MANKHAAAYLPCPPSSKKEPQIFINTTERKFFKKLGVFLLQALMKLRSSVQYVIISKINGLL